MYLNQTIVPGWRFIHNQNECMWIIAVSPWSFLALSALTDGEGPRGVPIRPVHQFIAAYGDLLIGYIHIGATLVLARHEHGDGEQGQTKKDVL